MSSPRAEICTWELCSDPNADITPVALHAKLSRCGNGVGGNVSLR
ncbi:hypothetical protein [Paenibacillus sp. NEAU-GSW1]|nr:hypothetical protein [Paenibacillus sp. NEAU-GSW1]